MKVQFDINCRRDVTEFVVSCVIAYLSKMLRRHFSIAMISELVTTTFYGICVAHQTVAAPPVRLRDTQLKRGQWPQVGKADIEFSSRMNLRGPGSLRKIDFAAPKINNLATILGLSDPDSSSKAPYFYGFFE